MRANFSAAYLGVTAAMILVIIYGSLYPFEFSARPDGPGPLMALLATWANTPGRGDFIANILLYAPLGFFGALALGSQARLLLRLPAILVVGVLLSLTMELTQYYTASRDTTATDLYANTIGTALGALFAALSGRRFQWLLLRQIALHRIPTLLLLAWIGYRLYPFVPTIDLHKYWNTVKPIFQNPTFSSYDIFRHTAVWLTVYSLLATLGAALRPQLLIVSFTAAVLFAKILVVSGTLRIPELVGAVCAYFIWLCFARLGRTYLLINLLLLSTAVILLRLEPFQFRADAVPFGWIPFRSFMYGSINVDVLSFLEKFFLYGSVIWLLLQLGLKPPIAGTLVAFVLFITSWLERYLPGRSAEITDAVMAIGICLLFGLIARGDAASSSKQTSRLGAAGMRKPLGSGVDTAGYAQLGGLRTHSVLPHQVVQGRPADTKKPGRF